MDLVTFSPDSFSRFLVDVTVRTPHATRCTQASVKPGEAASLGASDKRERYGESVLAIPLETYGRLGEEAESALWTLAQAAQRAGGNGTASRIHLRLEDEAAACCAPGCGRIVDTAGNERLPD